MTHAQAAAAGRSVLSLRSQVLDGRPDWPVVQVLVDGADPFADVAPGWQGFDPAEMGGPASPLLPVEPGRRVAVYRCSCGIAGCGVLAPVIVSSPDGRRVSWVDFRDYTGVFVGPVQESVVSYEGRHWDVPDLHFDRQQYLSEIARFSRDESWQTPRRRTALLLSRRLEPLELSLPPDLDLAWVMPAWNEDGVFLMFQRVSHAPHDVRQQVLWLTSVHDDPERAAGDMAQQLLRVRPAERIRAFGHQPW